MPDSETFSTRRGPGRVRYSPPVGAYSTRQVIQMTGATQRQLSHWLDQGRIPTIRRSGSGRPLVWTEEELNTIQLLAAASRVLRLPKPRSKPEEEAAVSA